MVNWLIIVLILLGIFIFLSVLRMRHKLLWIFIILIISFLIFSYVMVFKGKKVDLTTTDGVAAVAQNYLSWLGLVWDNTKTVTGDAINMNWKTNESSQKKK